MSVVICFCALVLLDSSVSANSARLILSSVRDHQSESYLSGHSEVPPPLEGCEDNWWSSSCCCFVDFGILKQNRCSCTSGPNSCQGKAQIEHSEEPSRPIPPTNSSTPKMWHSDAGYLRGYQAVSDEFCKAAPVRGAQIDHHERPYECTCSTTLSHIAEMECGSSCTVSNCKAWNPMKHDWVPFDKGRGTCCVSSYASTTGGCPQEVTPISADSAKIILQDAISHALINGTNAFVPSTSEHLMIDMKKSFHSARKKKMSTSRSGAQFFFSGNYKYILKSIHRPEYEVLRRITHSLPGGKDSLVDHIEEAARTSDDLARTGHCEILQIMLSGSSVEGSEPAQELVKTITPFFDGYWHSHRHHNRYKSWFSGTASYVHKSGAFRTYWCENAGEWRVQRADFYATNVHCEEVQHDALFQWLRQHRDEKGASMEDVYKVYQDFVHSFQLAETSLQIGSSVSGKCAQTWFPTSLINEFVIAFEYTASTWMVVKNSVASVQDELKSAGFLSFHKDNDLFDVKPFPIHSDERGTLFKMHFVKDGLSAWTNWDSVRMNLQTDVSFMDGVLDNPMVDYSLLLSVFYIADSRKALDVLNLPSCVEQPLASMRTSRFRTEMDYGNATGSILVCFSIIDILMEFTYSKSTENALLSKKWSKWSEKIMQLFDCLGNPLKQGCDQYGDLQSKFDGVDIPNLPTALVKDVSHYFDASGEVRIANPDETPVTYHMVKCCCNIGSGRCVLKDATDKSTSWFAGNPRGCGSLKGIGWRSFVREAGSCRVLQTEANALAELVVRSKSYLL